MNGARPSGPVLGAIGIVAFALALRLAHVLTIGHYPLFDVLPLDSDSYDAWAREIAAGEWSRGRPFYQAPLYAYVLAASHALTGGDLLVPRVLNAFLGAGTVAIVIRLGWLAFGPVVGLGAGALAAAHATYLFEEGKVMKTPLAVFLTAAALWLLLEARRTRSSRLYAAAGLVAGAGALVRENLLLFAIATVVFLAVRGPRPHAARVFALGTALALAPAAIHNFAYDGEWIPITSQAGQNFYTGSHRGNEGGGYLVPEFVRRNPRFEEIDFAKEAEARAGRDLTPGEVSSFWMREALRELAADPARIPKLFARKLDLLFRDAEIPDDEDIRFFRRYAPVLRAPLPGFGAFAVLGLFGIAVALARRRAPGELVLFVAVYAASVALFFVFSRYRLPLVAPLAVFAAFGAGEIARAVRAGRPALLVAAAVSLPLLTAIVFRPLPGIESFANSYLSVGIAHEVREEWSAALRAYEDGLAIEPDHPKLLRRWARLRISSEVPLDIEDTERLERARVANPNDASLPPTFREGTTPRDRR